MAAGDKNQLIEARRRALQAERQKQNSMSPNRLVQVAQQKKTQEELERQRMESLRAKRAAEQRQIPPPAPNRLIQSAEQKRIQQEQERMALERQKRLLELELKERELARQREEAKKKPDPSPHVNWLQRLRKKTQNEELQEVLMKRRVNEEGNASLGFSESGQEEANIIREIMKGGPEDGHSS